MKNWYRSLEQMDKIAFGLMAIMLFLMLVL